MALTLRFTRLSSPASPDWLDYVIVEDGRRDVGRLYEERHSSGELRWLWSITIYVPPKLGISTSGRTATMYEAMGHFLRNWQKYRADMRNASVIGVAARAEELQLQGQD